MRRIFLILSVLPTFIFAQNTQNIKGRVIDSQSKQPLPNALVILDPQTLNRKTLTDIDGYFKFTEVPVGLHTIVVNFLGYEPTQIRNLRLKSGKELFITVELDESVVNLQKVVVSPEKSPDEPLNPMAVVSARSFTVEQTERYAGTWLDPARMATNFAGVLPAGDHRNDIIIRGNSPAGLLWRLEGIDIPNPNHFGTLGTNGGPISILNNNLLDNSDFYTSAFPAEYGNALSGVFDLKMRNGNTEIYEYTFQIGMNGIELDAEGPLYLSKRSSFLASYRYSTLVLFDKLNLLPISGIPQFQDLSFKFNVPNTKLGDFAIFGVGGLSFINVNDMDNDQWTFGHRDLNYRFDSNMGVLGFTHRIFISKNMRLFSALAVSGIQNTAKIDSVYDDNSTQLFYGENSYEIRYTFTSKFTHKVNSRFTYNLGFMAENYDVTYKDSVLAPTKDYYISLTHTNDQLMILYQTYFQSRFKFSNNLIFFSGLHFQYFDLNGSKSLEPRFAVKWKFAKRQSFNAGCGLHSQLQPRVIYFLETKLPDGSYVYTNKNLDFSKSWHFVIGYNYLITKNLHLKLETYYQYLFNIPVEQRPSTYSLINYGINFFPEFVDSLVNDGTGKNYGIELTFERFLDNNFYFLFTSSLFESKYVASDGIERNTVFNTNYVFNFLAGYEFDLFKNSTFSINGKVVYAGGKRYIPVDFDKSQLLHREVLDYSRAYQPQYDPYFRLDGRVGYIFNLKKFSVEFAFDVQNITNHKNILLSYYDPKTNSVKYEYQMGLFYVGLFRVLF